MTRGKQKLQAQARNAARNQEQKGSQLQAQKNALGFTCPQCRIACTKPNVLIQHWASKHDKIPMPASLQADLAAASVKPTKGGKKNKQQGKSGKR